MKHYSRGHDKTSTLYPSITSQWDGKISRQGKQMGRSIYQRDLESIPRTTSRDALTNEY